MQQGSVYDTIKQTIHALLPDSRILLFGSHARGNFDTHSDYDLLVITPNLLSRTDRLKWSNQLHRDIVRAIHAPVDLLFYSEAEIVTKQLLPGHIVRTAIREGIAL